MFRIGALLFALCFAEAIPPALVPTHEKTSLLQAATAREVQHGGTDVNDDYGTWSMIKEKRGALVDLNTAKAAVLKRIQTETAIALKQIKSAHTGAMTMLKNSSIAGAAAATAATAEAATELLALKAKDSSDSTTELWTLMGSKWESMKSINHAKKATLESFLKAKNTALTNIKHAKLSSVHFIWKLAKEEVNSDTSNLVDLMLILDSQEQRGLEMDDRLEREMTELAQAISSDDDEDDGEDDEAFMAPSPAPDMADEPWTVRKARQDVLTSMKTYKLNVLESVTKYKNISLQHIKNAFMDAVHDIRAMIKDAA